jgi:hypothetical protein
VEKIIVMIPFKLAIHPAMGNLHLLPKPLHESAVDVTPRVPRAYLGTSGYLLISWLGSLRS